MMNFHIFIECICLVRLHYFQCFFCSALEVERHLLTHNDITDCAVVGKPDPVWGEVVAAIITVSPGQVIYYFDSNPFGVAKF